MFSSRTKWKSTSNPLLDKLENFRENEIPILDLTESNPTKVGFDFDNKAVLQAISQSYSLLYEPMPAGLFKTRSAIASYYASKGNSVNPESIFLTASTSEAYSHLFKLLANPNEEILIPQPSYPLFELLAGLESVSVVSYPLLYHPNTGWSINMDKLNLSISTLTKAIIVVNPNNPTGSYLKKNELAQLNQICEAHNLALIVDEVFSDFADKEDANRITTTVENKAVLTFVLNGFSKMLALPQMKLGWMQVNGPGELVKQAKTRLEIITDTYLSVNTPIQHAAEKLFFQKEEIQSQINHRIQQNLKILEELLNSTNKVNMLLRDGGWYAVLQVEKAVSDQQFTLQLLKMQKVFVHPGYFYDFPKEGFIVISLLTKPDIFKDGISHLIDFANKTANS